MGNTAFPVTNPTGRFSRLASNLLLSYNYEKSLDHNQKIKNPLYPEILNGKQSLNVWDNSHISIPITWAFSLKSSQDTSRL